MLTRRLLPLLAICLAVSAFSNTLGLQNVQSANCNQAQFQTFCAEQSYSNYSAGLVAGSLSQRTTGDLFDAVLVGIPPRTLTAEAKASGTTSFSGIHASLSADASYDSLSGTLLAAEAFYDGLFQDYLITSSKVPSGEVWDIVFSLSVTGNSAHSSSLDTGDDYTTTASMSIGISGATVNCPGGGGGGELNGPAVFTCIAHIPVQPLTVVGVSFNAYADAASDKGYATLDMSHTAKIDYVSIVNSQGTPDLNAQIFDRSGFNYNAASVATPEPSTRLLMLSPLLLLAFRRQRPGTVSSSSISANCLGDRPVK